MISFNIIPQIKFKEMINRYYFLKAKKLSRIEWIEPKRLQRKLYLPIKILIREARQVNQLKKPIENFRISQKRVQRFKKTKLWRELRLSREIQPKWWKDNKLMIRRTRIRKRVILKDLIFPTLRLISFLKKQDTKIRSNRRKTLNKDIT